MKRLAMIATILLFASPAFAHRDDHPHRQPREPRELSRPEDEPTEAPEPGTMALVGIGLVSIVAARKRWK